GVPGRAVHSTRPVFRPHRLSGQPDRHGERQPGVLEHPAQLIGEGDRAMSEFELVWDSRCGVAESPVWDPSTRRLLFCDIGGKRINALSVDDGARTSWELPEV